MLLVPAVKKLACKMKENLQIQQDKGTEAINDKYSRQLFKLLGELLETEKKYVLDLEEVCDVYLPLTVQPGEEYSKSLDRAKQKLKRQRSLNRPNSFHASSRNGSFRGRHGSLKWTDPPPVVTELE